MALWEGSPDRAPLGENGEPLLGGPPGGDHESLAPEQSQFLTNCLQDVPGGEYVN